MRSGPGFRKRSGPGQREAAAAMIQRFFWRTVVPLIPFFVIFYALLMINNRGDLSGDYEGSSPVTGAVVLSIKQEDAGIITGSIMFKQQYRMRIVKGNYEDENVDLHFQIPGNDNIIPRYKATHFSGPVSGINQVGNVASGDFFDGTFFNGRNNVPLKLKRNTATVLFKKYWFHF